MKHNHSIVWLRRDLRLHDHAALSAALSAPEALQCVFVFDSDILAQFANPHDRRVNFLARILAHLHAQLQARGGGMLVLHGRATEAIPKLVAATHAVRLVLAEDYEPGPIARDAAVEKALRGGCSVVTVTDHVMISPREVVKDDGSAFKVFTPYYKKWLSKLTPLSSAEFEVEDAGRYASYEAMCTAARAAGLNVLDAANPAAMLEAMGYVHREDDLWRVDDVHQRLAHFVEEKIRPYPSARNFMDGDTTSKLSPYLRFGLVSVRECVRAAEAKGGGEKWINELCWREFYMAIMLHFPEVAEHEFVEKYRGKLTWSSNDAHLQAFREGRTGYPIVDAAVRELLQTGWMHNRARMIVASFFSKDLFLDWRKGEQFFAEHLMDYEFSSNNGGWQWATSTGTDAAPYFRIFNPQLQSEKFDAEAVYIKRYVPELRNLSAKEIHALHSRSHPEQREGSLFDERDSSAAPQNDSSYPHPIVDHKTAKDFAVQVFRDLGHVMGGA